MMSKWRNKNGKPLSDPSWLLDHHMAKFKERKEFVENIFHEDIDVVVDLGCGPGLWLSIFNEIAPESVALIGIDSDEGSIEDCHRISSSWTRDKLFIHGDFQEDHSIIPKGDLYLAFNIFPFLSDPEMFLQSIKQKISPNGRLIIRQYDGGAMRFGPMNHSDRLVIDASLYAALGSSQEFHHYDMDRVYESIEKSPFQMSDINFELFQRKSPYPEEFLPYYRKSR